MAEALVGNAALLAGAMLLLWLLALALDKVSFIDAVWGLAMAGLALASWAQVQRPGLAATAITLMTAAWGLRLGLYLLRRFLRHGEDARYVRLLGDARAKGHWGRAALLQVFLLQAVLLFVVSSPAQVGVLAAGSHAGLTPFGWAGLALWLVGIVFEWLGDWQLARFKADPANAGKVMDRGLWRYTRHPNYFGDMCAWWGIWLTAASVDLGAAVWTLPGPVFLTFTLVRWSGAAMTERGMAQRYGEAFADYVRRTPAFVPWFPAPRAN